MQKTKRVEGLLNKRKKGQGPLGKTALSSPSSRSKQGRGKTGAPAAPIPALRATAAAGVRGKEGGCYGDSIPGPTSGWDSARRWGDEGRRRWAEVAAAAALQGQEGGTRGLGGFVEEQMCKEGPIYNQAMAVERCGAGGRLASIAGRH